MRVLYINTGVDPRGIKPIGGRNDNKKAEREFGGSVRGAATPEIRIPCNNSYCFDASVNWLPIGCELLCGAWTPGYLWNLSQHPAKPLIRHQFSCNKQGPRITKAVRIKPSRNSGGHLRLSIGSHPLGAAAKNRLAFDIAAGLRKSIWKIGASGTYGRAVRWREWAGCESRGEQRSRSSEFRNETCQRIRGVFGFRMHNMIEVMFLSLENKLVSEI
jgi:hypothetical protein